MPVPKRKMSRSRTRHRRSSWKTTPAAIANCAQCQQPKLQHTACPTCGTYNSRQVVEV
ncbi:MAG: 50S ribosomal protein L32 [Actinobacteria bacterium]|nr:50S ribosomal protein L32 [Actinomycetota bacterium]TSA20357.1 MAG: 50S ribosomal protein L32 [Actinomycetales bacterium]MSW22132.1 50S ribosomal protein L32 [Actinomycetota bacterium]MSX03348.1 50S ribosomal protein L32 [Actinomycetota bacterium]MSX83705.1 50S ribosomal protein L32 [Actinomycetota bacterium]